LFFGYQNFPWFTTLKGTYYTPSFQVVNQAGRPGITDPEPSLQQGYRRLAGPYNHVNRFGK